MMKLLFSYLVIVNALGFLLMLVDKRNAKTKRRRIKESTLLGLCAIGGSIGGLTGMYLLRHKTRHVRFVVGIPLMLIVHLALLYLYWKYLQ